MIKNRVAAVRKVLEESGLDAILFTDLKSIRYLCGFTGTDGALVVGRESDCFLTDSRYTSQAKAQVSAGEIRQYSGKLDGIAEFLLSEEGMRVGFEAETIPYAFAERLKEKGVDLQPLEKEILALRSEKDSVEVQAMEEATRISAEAFEEILPMVRPGAVEREIALALEFAMKRRGGEEKAFDFIVASGERGALPHGIASEKRIAAGELVTIDFGTRIKGYHSDETVTVAVGEVSPKLREIYDTVLEGHDRAMELVRPGVPLSEIDGAARSYIAQKGYGDYFGHGLGHGVGLDVHEYPTVSPKSEATACEGMVFTVEPGIYIPGLGGVRIEDMVLVTAEGARQLTRVPKTFRSV